VPPGHKFYTFRQQFRLSAHSTNIFIIHAASCLLGIEFFLGKNCVCWRRATMAKAIRGRGSCKEALILLRCVSARNKRQVGNETRDIIKQKIFIIRLGSSSSSQGANLFSCKTIQWPILLISAALYKIFVSLRAASAVERDYSLDRHMYKQKCVLNKRRMRGSSRRSFAVDKIRVCEKNIIRAQSQRETACG
jgi:hypothetical protein